MSTTSIEWTEATWNPVTGCSMVSPGCMRCHAERMSHRLKAMGQPNYVDDFEVRERAVRDECLASGTPFFFKPWGGPNRGSSDF